MSKRELSYLRLQDTTDDEEGTAAIDCKLAAITIGGQTGEDCANEGAATGDGRDQLLFIGRQAVAKIFSEGDEDARDVSSIIA